MGFLNNILRKFGLSGSNREIQNYLVNFSNGTERQRGMVVAAAALVRYRICMHDPFFAKLIVSEFGQNHEPIISYILQLNKLVNDLHARGEKVDAMGMKFWNINFRCMMDNSLHHYGIELWQIAESAFSEARSFLESTSDLLIEDGHATENDNIKGALDLVYQIPPQFIQ